MAAVLLIRIRSKIIFTIRIRNFGSGPWYSMFSIASWRNNLICCLGKQLFSAYHPFSTLLGQLIWIPSAYLFNNLKRVKLQENPVLIIFSTRLFWSEIGTVSEFFSPIFCLPSYHDWGRWYRGRPGDWRRHWVRRAVSVLSLHLSRQSQAQAPLLVQNTGSFPFLSPPLEKENWAKSKLGDKWYLPIML